MQSKSKLITLVVLVLFALFLFGCLQLDPVGVAKYDNVVKSFLLEHSNVSVKSGLVGSKDLVLFEKEISKNCLDVSTKDGLYKVSFADFNSKVVLNVWLNEGGTQVLCSYESKLTSGEKIVCLSGMKFNVDSNQCESKPELEYVCSIGTYNSVSNVCVVVPDVNYFCALGVFDSNTLKCEYTPSVIGVCSVGVFNSIINKCEVVAEKEIVCSVGVFNSDSNKCVYTPQLSYNCVQGVYNSLTGVCEVTPVTQIICSQGVFNEDTNTCEYSPPVQYVCEQGTYNETTQTCVYYPPVVQTCSAQNGNICSATQTCSVEVKIASDVANCCSGVCVDNIDNSESNTSMPYIVFRSHQHGYLPWPDKDFNNRFAEMEKTIALFDKYNASLTIGFGVEWLEKIMENKTKVEIVRQWQANGHEIGIEHHCATHGGWDGYSNVPGKTAEQLFLTSYGYPKDYFGTFDLLYEKFNKLAGKTVKTMDLCMKSYDIPEGVVYTAEGQPKFPPYIDARTSKVMANMFNDHLVYTLNERSGYADNNWSLAFEQCIHASSTEICTFVAHDEDYLFDNRAALEKVLKYFYEKDSKGKKIMTVSELMESYVIPNDLIIHERCGNTACDQEEFETGSCPLDCNVSQCNKCTTVNCVGTLCVDEYCSNMRGG